MHRFKHRVAFRLGDPIVYDFAQETPKTVGAPHQIPANSVAVQFLMENANTDASVTYNAVFALSAGVGDWMTPLTPGGAVGRPGRL